jgi:hypothetical protein
MEYHGKTPDSIGEGGFPDSITAVASIVSRIAGLSPLAERTSNSHIKFIEFRPNDLASPLKARLTDDPPSRPRISLLRA